MVGRGWTGFAIGRLFCFAAKGGSRGGGGAIRYLRNVTSILRAIGTLAPLVARIKNRTAPAWTSKETTIPRERSVFLERGGFSNIGRLGSPGRGAAATNCCPMSMIESASAAHTLSSRCSIWNVLWIGTERQCQKPSERTVLPYRRAPSPASDARNL